MTGTLLNVAAVLLGSSLGLALGQRIPARIRDVALQGVGLVTLVLGAQMALQVQNLLVLLASVVLGGALGEWAAIETRLDGLGGWLQVRLGGAPGAVTAEGARHRFVQGFVTSSLVFCVGPVTILGSLQDGLTGDYRLLAVKSLLDGITSLAFASALGLGVMFSAVVILVYQGALTLTARLAGAGLPDPSHTPAVLELTAAGGVLTLGLGLRLLDIKEVRVGNFLPSLALAPLLTVLLGPWLTRLAGGAVGG